MPKVALQLREHDLPAEVLDFQACRDGLADELVVRFDFFIRCFYQYFTMLVSEAHYKIRSMTTQARSRKSSDYFGA